MGCSYDIRRKTYYVDAHEKPETIVCRRQFIKSFLDSEIRMHRWIHLTSTEVASLEEKDTTLVNVKRFPVPNSDEVEFHDDSHELVFELANAQCNFGGRASFRKNPNEKPLLSIGNDEKIVISHGRLRMAKNV